MRLGALFQGGPMWVEENPEVWRSVIPVLALGPQVAVVRRGTGRRGRPRVAR
ncbi:hypothetical protein AB0B50_22375 [Streptomyces sp. NPDC041068]|uniref:hypothetical protein n=1 Tax=Streptomyces sp. NPDC041068 TaxID=3155130 RepID=UPI0033C687E8